REAGEGVSASENVNNNDGVADFSASLAALTGAAKNLKAAALVVSWFGDDLRAGQCALRPGVETHDKTTEPDLWTGGGVSRAEARLVSTLDGRPAYGGTPSDKGVIEAILAMKAKGLAVTMHPFILMDIPQANNLPDPDGPGTQGAYPWRGRISVGANDGTAAAASDVAAFFGAAAPGDFAVQNGAVSYSGPAEWSFRRMILHYAHLCAAAGGVEAFLLGSELKALVAARDHLGNFPAVAALKALAADVKAILPSAKISYGADWSEWSGATKADGRFFHLDPLWADENVDFIGIDYYPPLADWRDGFAHADLAAGWKSQYDRAYIAANIEGGENYDWFYASEADRAAQLRTPITDAVYGEPWIWRAKDIRNWWKNAHHDRPNFVRAPAPTAWVPKSKPIRFAEFGVPAVDKGANAPNVFVDPKSSESALPPFSTGARDDLMQRRAIEAAHEYWRANNEAEPGVPMIETDRLFVYAYDARPYPFFPARADIWGDAANWEKGHWLNGRLSRAPLDALVEALCAEAGVAADASLLKGSLAGYVVDRPLSPRQTIDPLADVFQFDMVETEAGLRFQPRGGPAVLTLGKDALVDDGKAAFTLTTAQKADLPSAVRLGFIDEGGDYLPAVAEARHPYTDDIREIGIELPAIMDEANAAARARSILADAGVMRETASLALPPSLLKLEPGDAVRLVLGAVTRDFRILSIADGAARKVEAARVAPAVYEAPVATSGWKTPAAAPRFGKPAFELMNLPLLREDDDPAAPYLAVFSDPWPGAVALYRGEALAATATARAVIGRLEADLPGSSASGRFDERSLRVRLAYGALASRSAEEVFAGANAAAVKTDAGWEVLQFRDATLGTDGVWTLKGLLRGQNGTEAEAALGAAAGARFVLLTSAVIAAALPLDLRGIAFDWRAGPAADLPSEPTFRTKSFTGEARGLRPLSPVHLVAVETGEGLLLSWVRRTRKGGDSWTGEDVPLGEAFERYRVEILNGESLVRTAEVSAPAFVYDAAMIAADFPPANFPAGRPPLTFRVAQLSDLVGPGAWGAVGVP
ncbi:MAG: glycoside hydrolase/phage tail family protein, partial [Parvularculaceae bacterium]|nr:glycoside hydrolase/phage tail family protein [Parvularculaceae bacterium]